MVYTTSNGPTTPGSYSKTKVSSCQYKISFKTASDNGKTSRVEIYRSDATSFNLDGSSRVANINIGSNQDGSFEESVPDCNKTWYYVLRAFDSLGNASGIVGDSVTTVSTTTVNPTTSVAESAIPVAAGQGSVLGTATTEGSVKGVETTVTPKPEVVTVTKTPTTNLINYIVHHKKITLGVVVLIALIIGAAVYFSRKKTTVI